MSVIRSNSSFESQNPSLSLSLSLLSRSLQKNQNSSLEKGLNLLRKNRNYSLSLWPNSLTKAKLTEESGSKRASSMLIFFLSFLTLIFQPSQCKTILVDGVSEWDSPTVHVGDSIIFNHKHHYKLYIFQNRGAFSVCNFTQATLLTKPNSTSFKWNPSRLGFFYFSFSDNGSLSPCQQGQKLAIEVLLPPSPRENVAPSPASIPPAGSLAPETGGGVISPSPAAYLWPFRPHGKPLRGARPPVVAATVPSAVPYNGVPFINSNPAVPLPTGEVDSATIRPLPTSGNGEPPQVAGLLAVQMPLCYLLFLML